MQKILDLTAICRVLTECCEHYERTAPTVHSWADDLYMRLSDGSAVDVRELLCLQQLRDGDEGWEQPNYAANRVYKLMDRLGIATAGQAGF